MRALVELIDRHRPNAAFVYSTCIVGLIGDDVAAVCRRVQAEKGISVFAPVAGKGATFAARGGQISGCAMGRGMQRDAVGAAT